MARPSVGWLVDEVLVRCGVYGQVFRWTVDDDAAQR
jgi:hypothetical protein